MFEFEKRSLYFLLQLMIIRKKGMMREERPGYRLQYRSRPTGGNPKSGDRRDA
jgi:hypothetical protein